MFDNIESLLPLIQMMAGNKKLNIADIMGTMGKNPAMGDMFKNMGGSNDMLSALMSMMSGGGNFEDILKNMGTSSNATNFDETLKNAGADNNMLNMLPLIQSMMGSQKPKKSRKAEPVNEPKENKNRFYNLKPISKIANKDITYILNQYFAG